MITNILMGDTLLKLFPPFNDSFRATESLRAELASLYETEAGVVTDRIGLSSGHVGSATTGLTHLMTIKAKKFYDEYEGDKMDVISIMNRSISRLLARRCVLVMKALTRASEKPDHSLHGLIVQNVENAHFSYASESAVLSLAMQPFLIALKKPYSDELDALLQERFEADLIDAAELKDAPSKIEDYEDGDLVLDLVFNAALMRIRSSANEKFVQDVKDLLKIRAIGTELN